MPYQLKESIRECSEEMNLNRDETLHILDMFIQSLDSRIKNMENSLSQKEWKLLKDEAHKLKGSSANLRLTKIPEISKELHDAVNPEQDNDFHYIQEKINTLQSMFEDLRQEYEKLPSQDTDTE